MACDRLFCGATAGRRRKAVAETDICQHELLDAGPQVGAALLQATRAQRLGHLGQGQVLLLFCQQTAAVEHLKQRAIALNLFVADVYGDGKCVRDGIIRDLADRGVGRERARMDTEQRTQVEQFARRYFRFLPDAPAPVEVRLGARCSAIVAARIEAHAVGGGRRPPLDVEDGAQPLDGQQRLGGGGRADHPRRSHAGRRL